MFICLIGVGVLLTGGILILALKETQHSEPVTVREVKMTITGSKPTIMYNIGDLVRYTQITKKDGKEINLTGEIRKIDVEMNRFEIFEYYFPWHPKSIANIYWINGSCILRSLTKDESTEIKKQILIDTQILEYD